jgi:hypothetical protein
MSVNETVQNNFHAGEVDLADNTLLTPGTSADEATAHTGNGPHGSTKSYAEIWCCLNEDLFANDYLQPLRLWPPQIRLRPWARDLLGTKASPTFDEMVNHRC